MKHIIAALLVSFLPFASFAQAEAVIELTQPSSMIAGDQYYNYNFGSTFVNSRKYVDFTVTSTGDEPLQLKELGIAGAAFNAYTNCPTSLPPGQKCTVRATFWPSDKRSYSGRLYLVFAHGRSIINLYGRGI
ncbi:hypothetical protein ACLVWU_03540 [Bdellovibrio sp. HCB290]|uniref:Ig-like domain-containing protein n=1 Tax=Bdellovibrio sp. HCB290 TaxID=3394356 RepID=UPI0039B5877D